MNRKAIAELRQIRNELAHGRRSGDPREISRQLTDLGINVSGIDPARISDAIIHAFGDGASHVPAMLSGVLQSLLEGHEAQVVVDPFARLGSVLAIVQKATGAERALAFTKIVEEAEFGKALFAEAEWEVGDPLHLLNSLTTEVDVVASVLPFGAKSETPVSLPSATGSSITLQGDVGGLVLAAAAQRLSEHGLGLFVVTASFFFSLGSVRRRFDELGLGIEAAFALPFGAFVHYANVQTYLVVVRRKLTTRLFVGQLTNDVHTNQQVIENFKRERDGATLDLGRFVSADTFTGLQAIRLEERLTAVEEQIGAPAVRLSELATSIRLGRSDENFVFLDQDNAVFVPLLGNGDVVESLGDGTLKPQNYAQVVIDSQRSNSRFVARYLNSDLGRELRELSKAGSTILRLNRRSLGDLRIFVPDLLRQKAILEIEARLTAEQNTLLSIQNEIEELRRELWLNRQSEAVVEQKTRAIAQRLSGSFGQQSEVRLEQWCESLPFPLASILRTWQATPTQDFKGKFDHLIHFFEAAAEFTSVILLSAFCSNESVFAEHRPNMVRALQSQNLSFERSSFGTWKVVVENLGKQTRALLAGDSASRALCAELFADPTLTLPEHLSRKAIVDVLSTTNKLRNDWKGHGGILGQEEAKLRNEQLLGELERFREAFADLWTDSQLVHALHCRPRRGVFENEIAILMGSNSEFLKETRPLSTWLDVERLYVTRRGAERALQLLPLVRVGPSPSSAQNACYFFNRLDRDRPRFVSYHFIDMPELNDNFEDATETIRLLAGFGRDPA